MSYVWTDVQEDHDIKYSLMTFSRLIKRRFLDWSKHSRSWWPKLLFFQISLFSSRGASNYIQPRKCNNYYSPLWSHLIKCAYYCHPDTCTRMKLSYIFIPWTSVTFPSHKFFTFTFHEFQSNLHPMTFGFIFIPWNSVTFSFHKIQSHLIRWNSVTASSHETQ